MEERYDNITWSYDYTNSNVSVTAYDIDNRCSFHKNLSIRDIVGMINEDGDINHITCSKVISIFNNELNLCETDVEEREFTPKSFFTELLYSQESWFNERGKNEYIAEINEAVHNLLNGVKKELKLS
jgi:hypothetical protein